MNIQTNILENLYLDFTKFIKLKSDEEFQSFRTSKYLIEHENYKYSVYNDARERLGSKFWKPEDVGTGKIQKDVFSALKTKVIHNYKVFEHNLIDWRKKDDFSKLKRSNSLESTFFNLYKSKVADSTAFQQLQQEGLPYQLIAYLFFIKEKNRFLPISQERFDIIFKLIGIPEFKTSDNISWENYNTFCSIIKQVKDFLKSKDRDVNLLDAHSFLWILGSHMEEYFESSETSAELKTEVDNQLSDISETSENESDDKQRNPKWERDEIILALELYFKLGSGQIHARNPQVIELSETLNKLPIHKWRPNEDKFRNPNGVGLKLSNFLALDPSYEGKGMASYSRLDEEVFNEFVDDRDKLNQIAKQIKQAVSNIQIREDLQQVSDEELDDTESVKEGRVLYKLHKYKERDPSIAKKKKRLHLKKFGHIRCEVCGFDFVQKYGEIGTGFIECHHKVPLSESESITETKMDDLALVCANCHRMLHKKINTLNIEELKVLIEQKRAIHETQ